MSKKITKLFSAAALAGLIASTVSIAPIFADDEKATKATTATASATKAAAVVTTSAAKPHIDLAFCIDTTGSMQNEIENVKAKTKELVAKLAGGKPSPVIRVGMVAFRDHGDAYVTKVFPFSDDIDKVVKDISSLQADGGGDTPEAVTEGLHSSLHDLKWSDDKKTLKMLFLIGDAGPHFKDGGEDYKAEARAAIAKGVQINTLGCQGLEQTAEVEGVGVFKEIAKLTDGRYESLAYHETVVGADGKKMEVVASGGKVYRMKTKADWRAGTDALAARGAAEVVAASPVASAPMSKPGRSMYAAPMSPAFAGAGGGGASFDAGESARAFTAVGKSRGRAVVREYAEAMPPSGAPTSAMAVSRGDNNLADVIYAATRDAASKKLKVDFKE